MLGGYSDVARALTLHFGLVPPLDRRAVERWYRRGTANADGLKFPGPIADLPGTLPRQAHLMFETDQVVAWAKPGWPRPHSNQHQPRFETPEEYNARWSRTGHRV